ncbi:hypothetical protein AAZV13_08G212850 [Glycine max]
MKHLDTSYALEWKRIQNHLCLRTRKLQVMQLGISWKVQPWFKMNAGSMPYTCKSDRKWRFQCLDCRLQLTCMKLESLVITSQPYDGEFILQPCTHRSSHYGSCPCQNSLP